METTWSGVAMGMMTALETRPDVDLVRVDAQHNLPTAAVVAGLARFAGYGTWKHSRLNRSLTDARVRRKVGRLDVDAVVGLGDVGGDTGRPTFVLQDANFSVTSHHRDLLVEHAPMLAKFPAHRLEELVAEQRAGYAGVAGVLSFSQWFADWLVGQDGVSPERVHVVGGGLQGVTAVRDLETRGPGGTKVLFIGREFFRKGGDLVVGAIERLRASGSGDFTLTVVGPAAWPLPTPVPPWVDFRSEVPAAEVRQLWAEHDIFALPSWYEPFGLVFLEARAAGVPALGRDAFCMPELVPADAGRLIPPDGGVDAVAENLLAMSSDAQLFADVAQAAQSVRQENSWAKVAERTVDAIQTVR